MTRRLFSSLLPRSLAATAVVLGGLAGAFLPGPAPAQAAELLPHVATYSVRLPKGAKRSGLGLEDAFGTIEARMEKTCKSWKSLMRMSIVIVTRGQQTGMVQALEMEEWLDGSTVRVEQEVRTESQKIPKVIMTAKRREDGIYDLIVTSPRQAQGALPADTIFPAAFMERVVSAAEAGERSLTVPYYFDGSVPDALEAHVTIKPALSRSALPQPQGDALPEGPVWPLSYVLYPIETHEMTPFAEVDMEVDSHGIATGLTIRMPQLELEATLTKLELLDSGC